MFKAIFKEEEHLQKGHGKGRLKKKEAYTKTFKKSLYEKPVNGPARSFKKEAFERN